MFSLDSIKSWFLSIFVKHQVYEGSIYPLPEREQKEKTVDMPKFVDKYRQQFIDDPEFAQFDRDIKQIVSNFNHPNKTK